MTVSQDYVGRSVDLCVLETPAYPGPGPVAVGVTSSGTAVSGPYKVVQKFTKFLLTELGSVPGDPEYGTTFAVKLLNGHINTIIGLELELYADLPDAINYVAGTVLAPVDSESLSNVLVDGISSSQDGVTVRLKFIFKDSSVILAPVAISTV